VSLISLLLLCGIAPHELTPAVYMDEANWLHDATSFDKMIPGGGDEA
jgi:hypothetical protein